jgi:hypothetical protein
MLTCGFGDFRSSVCTVVSPPRSIRSTISEPSTGSKKFLMKGRCVIFSGLTQMIGVDGESVLEVLDTRSDRISARLSVSAVRLCIVGESPRNRDKVADFLPPSPSIQTITTDSLSSLVRINWSWRDTRQCFVS